MDDSKIMNRVLALTLLLLLGCSRKPAVDPSLNLETQFEQMMAGAVLVGHSTLDNREGLSREERYSIDRVTQIGGGVWMFQARMKLSDHEIPLPIPVTIKWAGDTPVITITDMSIPGMGSYTARVVLYRNRYAGTWSGKDHGGELFGSIVHEK
jgi:hypothetical protein